MIILITGTPGSGKSLYAVGALLNGQFKDRPKFVNGIPDLLLEHTPLTDDDVQQWYQGGKPDPDTGKPSFEILDAVICVDEVQRIARPRAASVPAPEWIKRLEVHRHSGCDFIFITQHPQQIDAHVRRLVGRHIHVRRTWALNSAVVYEWDSCNNNLGLKTAQSKMWRYPKKVFELYKSSEKHTKAGGRIPLVVWVVLAAALAFPIIGWKAVQQTLMRFTDDGAAAVSTVQGSKVTTAPASAGNAPHVAASTVMTRDQYQRQYEPRMDGMMHTAPAYDELTKPKTVPLPAACIESLRPSWIRMHGGPCGCYTQTGQPYETTQPMCARYVRNLVFFPFLEGPGAATTLPLAPAPKTAPTPAPAPESVPLNLVGNPTATVATATTSTAVADAAVLSFMARRSASK